MTGIGIVDEKYGGLPSEKISVNNSMNFNVIGNNNISRLDDNFKLNMDVINDDSSKYTSESNNKNVKSNTKGEEDVCRICLGTEDEGTPGSEGEPDKLICPCKCAGSMGLIHISCLKEWVNSKRLIYKGKKVCSFFWKALECELC
jgi:hypothetical protein